MTDVMVALSGSTVKPKVRMLPLVERSTVRVPAKATLSMEMVTTAWVSLLTTTLGVMFAPKLKVGG